MSYKLFDFFFIKIFAKSLNFTFFIILGKMRFGSVVWLLPLFFALTAAQFGFQNVLNAPKDIGSGLSNLVSNGLTFTNHDDFLVNH